MKSKHIFYVQLIVSKIAPFMKYCEKNTVQPGRPQMKIWHMLFECWAHKATNTHSEYVTHIAFPLATVAARTRLNVTLYVHCLSCLPLQTFVSRENF